MQGKPNTGAAHNKPTKVKPCTCEHPFQDSRYGKGNRVMNPGDDSSGLEYRCTVCGRKHNP